MTKRYRTREEWLADLRQALKEKNCKLFGDEPTSTKHEIMVRCYKHEGDPDAPSGYHEWRPNAETILSGAGCALCNGTARLSQAQVERSASLVRLTVCSEVERGSGNRPRVKCRCDECDDVQWHNLASVRAGVGCEFCTDRKNGLARRTPTPEVVAQVEAFDLTFVSEKYIEGVRYVTTRCRFGHEHTHNYKALKRGKGCAICSKLPRGETIFRQMVEHLTGFKWPKTRPKWLRSPKVRRKSSRGVPLELDGFCEELLAAFEFQGQQHNREVAHFGGRSKYDPLKVRRCRQKRVKLMRPTIEEFEAAEKKGKEALLRWAAGMLTKRGIRLRPGGLKRLIRSFRLKVNSARVEELTKECHEYAAAHEGEFLGKMCLSPTDEHRWLCTTHGKVFKNTLTIMKSAARFCPDCGREDNADAAKGRRQDFPTLSGFRRECRRLGVEHYWQFRQGRNILAFKVSMPKDPMDYYKVTARQLFQKTSPHSEPWQYTDEHDDPADLLSHPNWNVRLLSSGKRRRARRGAAAAAHR